MCVNIMEKMLLFENNKKDPSGDGSSVMCLPQQQGLQSWSQPQFMGPQQPPQPLAP